MSERATGGDAVAHALLDLPHLGEAALLLARPDDLFVHADLENTARRVRGQDHGANLLREGRQQLLRHPTRAQAPAAQPAVDDLDGGTGGHGSRYALSFAAIARSLNFWILPDGVRGISARSSRRSGQ